MAKGAEPLPGIGFNLYQLHDLADAKNLRITEVLEMPIAEIEQYFTYYFIKSEDAKNNRK